jgi:hypothetical protein
LIYGVLTPLSAIFQLYHDDQFLVVGRSRSTRREPPTMDKQLVNVITCNCYVKHIITFTFRIIYIIDMSHYTWLRARVAQWFRLLVYLTIHTSLSPIRRGFSPSSHKCQTRDRLGIYTVIEIVYMIKIYYLRIWFMVF